VRLRSKEYGNNTSENPSYTILHKNTLNEGRK
jgi:hypothetical protein